MRAILRGTDKELSNQTISLNVDKVIEDSLALVVEFSPRQFLSFTGSDPRYSRVPTCVNIRRLDSFHQQLASKFGWLLLSS